MAMENADGISRREVRMGGENGRESERMLETMRQLEKRKREEYLQKDLSSEELVRISCRKYNLGFKKV